MSKRFNWTLIILIGLYLVTRLWGLISFPLFTDEVYYLRLIRESQNVLWVSFADGKEPLFFWLLTLITKFSPDPIMAGRGLSVLAGLGTMVSINGLGKELFDQKIGLIAALFYLFSPFALIYNRLSILDGLLVFLLTGFLYFLVKAGRNKGSAQAILAGVSLGLALITKTISQLFVLTVALATGFFPGRRNLILIVIVAGLIYLPLSLAPGYATISQKNLTFAYAPGYALTHIRITLIANLIMSIRDWLLIYLGLLPLAGIFLAGIYGLLKKNKQAVFLTAVFLLPLLAEAFIARIFFPRYLLFLIVPTSLLNAYLIYSLKPKILSQIILAVFLLQPLILFGQIETQPAAAGLPVVEQWQFFTGWPSELKAARQIDEVRALAVSGKVTVATENYGVGEFVRYYFYNDPRVSIKIISNNSTKIEADYVAFNE